MASPSSDGPPGPVPFAVEVSEAELSDLMDRLRRTRLPDAGPQHATNPFEYGTPVPSAAALLDHWLHRFDWRAQEQRINAMGEHLKLRLPATQPELEQLEMHFVRVRGAEVPTVPGSAGSAGPLLPLLLLHGWPGSFWEFHKVAPQLAAAGFTCIVPSLPGYGFSAAPQQPGWDTGRCADAMDALMRSLGHDAYFVQGGDWGSVIAARLGVDARYGATAVHLNMAVCGPPKGFDMGSLDEVDVGKLGRLAQLQREGVGYQKIQQTKPQSLAYGLTDSPLGLGAYILEKMVVWSDTTSGGGQRNAQSGIALDDILTNVCIYWWSGCIASSMRLYFETLGLGPNAGGGLGGRVTVPCAIAELPKELFNPPMAWVRAAYNVQQHTKFERGGHFAALECPDALAADIVTFFSKMSSSEASSSSKL